MKLTRTLGRMTAVPMMALILGLATSVMAPVFAADTPKLMYTDPYLLAPVASSMNVCWLTSEKTDSSYVEYGSTEGYGSTQIA